MNSIRFLMLSSAFFGFVIAMLGWIAVGFHQQDAGYLDLLTCVAIALVAVMLWDFVRDADENFVHIDEECDCE